MAGLFSALAVAENRKQVTLDALDRRLIEAERQAMLAW
jgi:hypothetical protein